MKKKQLLGVLFMAMMGASLVACKDKEEHSLVKEEEAKSDLSQFEGTWMGKEDAGYDSLMFDKNGNWEMYADDQVIASGTIEYVQKDDCYYVYNEQDGTEEQFQVNEDGTIAFDSYGTFASSDSEEQGRKAVTLNYFSYYFDMWYKDGSLEEVSLLLDENGIWEVYDSMGLAGSGTIAIDTDTNDALVLLDESGEQAAYVQVDDTDTMAVEVMNEELMKLPQTCTLYRESDCR